MNQGSLTRSVLREYRQADAIAQAGGRSWYIVAREIAENIAAGTPYTVEQVAGVIAELSAGVAWEHNVDVARAVVSAHAQGHDKVSISYRGYSASLRRAFGILDGIPFRGGAKTSQFFRAILGDPDAVPVDRHAYRAAVRREPPKKIPVGQHRIVQAAYRSAAAREGIEPRTMQAIVWCSIRGKVS